MKKILLRLLLVLGLVFIIIQFFGPAKTNPPVDETKTIAAGGPLPTEIAIVLERACYDCHSNQTRWPWYSNVAPVSWFVIGHVNDARKHLNFSEWATYNPKRMKRKLEEIKPEEVAFPRVIGTDLEGRALLPPMLPPKRGKGN